MPYFEFDLGDELPRIGSGRRRAIAILGRKHARIICPFSLVAVTMPLASFAKLRKREVVEYSRRKLIGIMRHNRMRAKARGSSNGGEWVRKAMQELRGP